MNDKYKLYVSSDHLILFLFFSPNERMCVCFVFSYWPAKCLNIGSFPVAIHVINKSMFVMQYTDNSLITEKMIYNYKDFEFESFKNYKSH